MRIQKIKALLLLLLLWAIGMCLSVSDSKIDVQQKVETTYFEGFKEQLNPEEQSRAVAWSEPTAPHHTLAKAADKPLSYLTSAGCLFLLYKWLPVSPKDYRIPLAFSTLSEQFRIQPNAP